MKVLVTGGCGFLGSNICLFYKQKGAEVISYDNLTKHEFNKKLYIIDASCRLSGSVGATIASGLNLPEILISLGNRKIIKKTITKKNLYFFPVKIFYSKNQLH